MHRSSSQNNLYVPENQVSLFRHVIKQLGVGKSLAEVTLPSWFLERRSILERFTDWMLHADILRRMNDEELPEMRMLALCTWIISGFHMTPCVPKKPYSSLRGECFRAALYDDISDDNQNVSNNDDNDNNNDNNNSNDNDNNDNSNDNNNNNNTADINNMKLLGTYIAEQVTQHPSVCAFHYKDRDGNIIVWGNAEMKSKISFNSVAAIMDNPNTKVNVEHLARGESYIFNFPDMYGRGVFSGPKVLEIVGKVRIACKQTGYVAKITFLAKGINSSKTYNSLKGKISKIYTNEKGKQVKEPVIQFQGHWDDKVYYWFLDDRQENNNSILINLSNESSSQASRLNLAEFSGKSQLLEESSGNTEKIKRKNSGQIKMSMSTSSLPIKKDIPKKPNKSKKSDKECIKHLMFNVKSAKMLHIVVPPIEEQSQYESRFVWRRVTEYLDRNDPETANKYQKALTENLKKTEKCFEASHKEWKYQLFNYNEQEKRFIPKDLDLSLHNDNEPPLEMHPGFVVPPQVVELQEAGKIKTTLQVQQDVDASLQSSS